MKISTSIACAAAFSTVAVVTSVAFLNQASGQDSSRSGTALGTFSASGNMIQVTTLLNALSERNKAGGSSQSSFAMFIPDPFQMMEYGSKAGLHSFLRGLPRGSIITLLVADVRKLAAIGDKEPVLTFMKGLDRSGLRMEIKIVDAAGLSYVGEKAELLTFISALPRESVVEIYTTPSEISNNGADAGLIRFVNAVPCKLEIHVDDPGIRNYLLK